MKLDDIKDEFVGLFKDVRGRLREATVNYQGRNPNYDSNKRRAFVGVITGIATYPFIPVVGVAALGYAGIKAYQAYKDKTHDKEAKNARRRHTI